MSKFTMSINPVIGKKEWVEQPEYYDYYQEVARSSYADMLHDTERNEKYYAAIKKAVQSMKDQGRPIKVLDIGTGTGLLSMMAARCGADVVTACEVFHPVAKCAEEVIKQNGYDDKIKVVLKHSTDLTVGPEGDLKEKANILVAEVFDTELIGEGALRTFQHALEFLLEDDSIVIPSAACVYAQVIDSPLVSSWNKLSPVQVGTQEKILPPKNSERCPGSAAVHDLQMSQIPQDKFTAITDPICVFKFSFIGEYPIEMKETSFKQVSAIHSGNCEVVFMWWDLKMDMDGDIILNNGPKWVQPDPNKAQWRDHWMQAIYYLPTVVSVTKGDKFTLTACHDQYSLWFAIPKGDDKSIPESPACNCLVHVTDPHSRIGMKNDVARNESYIAMLEEVITPSSVVLCISDGTLLPLMAVKLGAKKVFTIEESHFHQKMIRAYLEENDKNNLIKIVPGETPNYTEEHFEKEKITVLVTEPYFVNSQRPWELMCYSYMKKQLQNFLAPNAAVVPYKGRLMGVAVDFDDLWKIRAPVKNAEGFDLSKFDEMVQRAISMVDATVEPHPLWEYPCKPVSEAFSILEFDFASNSFSSMFKECEKTLDIEEGFEVSGRIPISNSGKCNAVALWTDYTSNNIKFTNGPIEPIVPNQPINWYMHSQQGVYFIHPPTSVISEKHILKFKLIFDSNDTSFVFKVEERQF